MIDTLVVMPVYNAENTILDAIKSIKNQKYKKFKLVCCDDNSEDKTLEQLINCREIFDFKILKNKKNIGTGLTISKTIEIESSFFEYKYITWVSADNILNENFLQKHIEKISSGYAITYSGWRSFDLNSNYSVFYPDENLESLKVSYKLGPSFLFTKNLYDKAGPFNKLPGEDFYFAVKCAINDAKFGFIKDNLVDYRVHNNSVSGRIRSGKIKELATDSALMEAIKINKKNGNLSYQ